MFTQAPGTKNALFLKIFCRLNISWTYFHCWRPDLWSPAVVMMLWFDFINIFGIHNQLKCHMILFLGKDMLAPVPSVIVMTDNLSACDWSGQITWPEHCSDHDMSPVISRGRYQGTLSWPGTGPRRHQPRGEYSAEIKWANFQTRLAM